MNEIYTGERFEPSQCDQEMFIEHTQRYSFAENFVKGKVVLDAASGNGYGSKSLSKMAKQVIGMDIDEGAVQSASATYRADNLSYIQGSITDIPLNNDSVDVVVSFETIEHVDEEEQNKFLDEVKRVINENGLFIVSTPNKAIYTDLVKGVNPYHIRELYNDEFCAMLKKRFRYVDVYSQSPMMLYVLGNCTTEIKCTIPQLELDKSRYCIAVCSNEPVNIVDDIKINVNTDMYYMLNKVVHKYERDVQEVQTDARNLQIELQKLGREYENARNYIEKLEKDIKEINGNREMLQMALNRSEEKCRAVSAELERTVDYRLKKFIADISIKEKK